MGEASQGGTDMLEATGGAGLPQESSGGGFAGSAASGLSIASLGLGAYSSIAKGQATKAADEMQAARAERAAEFGKLTAVQTDTVMREQLNTTLANIDVIRSAAHIDPTSPTTAAVEGYSSMLSNRQRTAALLGIKSQIAEDEASAQYLRKAGDYALQMGYIDAGVKVATGIAKAAAAA